ncbi:hypothetical protein BCR33DRAFT_677462 [Rhizoclosmatium globosum]|uniref:Uncharacterized protein n=1 Tax=Rhizoclosmatium globosum TaxID=329046 RepID=A0A1Y2CND8_9FUNG|nr:hypothetical protein BCR33DRAFT_677462 [Rhizoclosmatium globosum]|eukprot:ORY48456.1 hypothetical protein BCR33DRAFT_677462 [Rhizoclosmatium globosum]
MHKAVDADYYGYRDEDDGELVAYETKLRAKMYEAALAYDISAGFPSKASDDMEEDGDDPSARFEETKDVYKFVDECIPTLAEVEAWIVRKRKQELLDQFLGDAA